jgi:DNA repair exonuclease SbcCD ATPase subunit
MAHPDDKKQLQLRLELESDKYGTVTLSRGKVNELTFGTERFTGAEAIKDKLQQILGVPLSMLGAFIYSPQQDAEDFLSLANADKQEFLATLLGLSVFEEAADKAQKNAATCRVLLADERARLEAARASVQQLESLGSEAKHVDLQELEAAAAAAQELVRTADWATESLRLENEAHESRWSSMLEAARPSAIDPIFQRQVQDAKSQFLAFQQQVKASEPEDLRNVREQLRLGLVKLGELQASDAKKFQEFQSRCRALDKSIAEARAKAGIVPKLRKVIDDRSKDIEALSSNRCQTCGKPWDDAGAEFQRLQLLQARDSTELTAAQQAEGLAKVFAQELHDLVFTPDPLIRTISEMVEQSKTWIAGAEHQAFVARQAQIDVYQAQIALAERSLAAASLEAQKGLTEVSQQVARERAKAVQDAHDASLKLRDLRAKHEAAVAEVQRWAAMNAMWSNEHEARQGLMNKLRNDVAGHQMTIDTLTLNQAAEEDFAQLVGREGFLGAIFNDVLAEISAETNDILGRIANTAHVTLEFRSEIENKKGTVTKEIRPIVTIGGFEAPMKSGCSGGMYSAVRLAVRIAIRRVIGRRTGSEICWLALDESFDGLDDVCKEACAEILNDAARTDLIFVVDHGAAFKAMVVQTIELEFKNGSTIIKESST